MKSPRSLLGVQLAKGSASVRVQASRLISRRAIPQFFEVHGETERGKEEA